MKSKAFLNAAQVAAIVSCDPQTLRSQAKTNPVALGFPVTIVGNRLRFPSRKFCAFAGITEDELQALLNRESPTQEAANA